MVATLRYPFNYRRRNAPLSFALNFVFSTAATNFPLGEWTSGRYEIENCSGCEFVAT